MQDISFRVRDKQYRVRFLGGPLDGAEIMTDIKPNSSAFLHRSSGRVFEYRYHSVDGDCYEARFQYGGPDPSASSRRPWLLSRWQYLVCLGLLAGMLSCVTWLLFN